MAVPASTVYLVSAALGATTWDASSGGPMSAEFSIGGSPISVRSGNDIYPRAVVIPTQDGIVTVNLLTVKTLTGIGGTAANLVLTLATPAASTTITFATMVLASIRGSQSYGAAGGVELTFHHQSADGQAVPAT
jgi:hypothetical protein